MRGDVRICERAYLYERVASGTSARPLLSEEQVRSLVKTNSRLSTITRSDFEALLLRLADNDARVHKQARAALEELCYLRVPGVFAGAQIQASLKAQQEHLTGSIAIHPLLDALRSGHPRMRIFAAEILRLVREEAAVPLLADALAAPEAEVRASAATALGAFAHLRPVEPLLGALADPEQEVRSAAAMSLGSFHDARAVPALLRLLSSRNERDRVDAVFALGWIHDACVLPAIRSALTDRSRKVRKSAKLALANCDLLRRGTR